MQGYSNSREHLFDELGRLDLLLSLRVARQRLDPAYSGFTEFRGLFITEDEVDSILDESKNDTGSECPQGQTGIQSLSSALYRHSQQVAERAALAEGQNIRLSLRQLARRFDLSPFDVDAMLVCLAPELDLKYEKLYAYLQDDVTRKRPTVDLILNLLCRSLEEKIEARARFHAASPLFKHHLLFYSGEAPLDQTTFLSRCLKIDDRVLNYLLEVETIDEQLVPFTKLIVPEAELEELLLPSDFKQSLICLFRTQCFASGNGGGHRGFIFHGPRGSGKKYAAETLCGSAGMDILIADLPRMLAAATNHLPQVTRLLREAILRNAAVYLDHAEVLSGENEKAAQVRLALPAALAGFPGLVFVGSEQPIEVELGAFPRFAFPVPSGSLRRQMWLKYLMKDGGRVSAEVDLSAIAGKFKFTAGKIRRAVAEARQLSQMRGGEGGISTDDLHRACRMQSNARLSTLARKITPLYGWDDIVLPKDRLMQLREICAHVRQRSRVFDEWNFDRKLSLGKGLSVLFAGPSGTGKTMAAEIIAGELGIDIYKIDLSSVVSKYIGETEKNLSRIFEEAEESNAILFFDEADALFGKRSEVRDSHDRYANIEINYLLQKMEEYEGIVILASNFQKNIDEAFTRRLRFVVEFPFPDEEYRYHIWKVVFPARTPLDGEIDFGFLASKFKLAGGSIKNIALNAAFLAAGNSGVVDMEHIIRATRRELQKMGRLCVKTDFGQYFDLLQNGEPGYELR
jgi:SpoVK/Ycf46/Vps4 family AAA+-type ATPase